MVEITVFVAVVNNECGRCKSRREFVVDSGNVCVFMARSENVRVFLTEGEAWEWVHEKKADCATVFEKTVFVPWLSVGTKSANKLG